MRKRPVIAICLASAGWTMLAGAAPPSSADFGAWYDRVFRVEAISRQILAANTDICPRKRSDFGFTALAPAPDASAAVRAALAEGLGLGEGQTVVLVHEGGPAGRAGLHVGDQILAANGVAWGTMVESRAAFALAMRESLAEQRVVLTVQRRAEELAIAISAEQICDADVVLRSTSSVHAWATERTIVIEGPLEELLTSNDELAWVIAHEAAHVFLGHVPADQTETRVDRMTRARFEREADELSLPLMLRAGFAPEAAATALTRIAPRARRGLIGRLFDLHGPYMPPPERVALLAARAAAARAEAGS